MVWLNGGLLVEGVLRVALGRRQHVQLFVLGLVVVELGFVDWHGGGLIEELLASCEGFVASIS